MSDRQSFYIGVKGIIKNADGHILILKDAARNKWELPGGRVDKDQQLEESFAREIEEEIPGAHLKSLDSVLHVAQGDFTVENEHKLLLAFYDVRVELPEAIVLSEEHTDFAWVNIETLDDYEIFTTDKKAIVISLREIV